jgi:hypothetical protein
MKIHANLGAEEVRKLIIAHLEEKTGGPIKEADLTIEVKSKQNYKAEWERADFRAQFSAEL